MNNRKLKAFALSMGLGAAMLTAPPVQAQLIGQRGDSPAGLFPENSQKEGLMQRGSLRSGGSIFGHEAFGAAGSTVGNEAFGANGSIIHNEPFGVPLGGGLGILLAAGAGYALIQSKKNKQN